MEKKSVTLRRFLRNGQVTEAYHLAADCNLLIVEKKDQFEVWRGGKKQFTVKKG